MQLNTVIFDMDGLLIDSEPLWNEAATEVFKEYGINLSDEQQSTTTGLRTREFLEWWFNFYNIGNQEFSRAEKKIIDIVFEKIQKKGNIKPGVDHIFNFFHDRNFKIGIASQSPAELIELVMDICGIRNFVQSISSAQHLPYGKPHPQVYLNCAGFLQSHVLECLCFEDSFNGLIAVKASRMKCVIVPERSQQKDERWEAADLKLSSLQNFGALHLNLLQ